MAHLKNLHDELRKFMREYRHRLNCSPATEKCQVAHSRLVFYVAYRRTNEILQSTIAAMPMARMPRHAKATVDEYNERMARISRAYSAQINAWGPDRIESDRPGFLREVAQMHRSMEQQFLWEESMIAPLLTEAARLRGESTPPPHPAPPPVSGCRPSSDRASPAPPHTIGASSSA